MAAARPLIARLLEIDPLTPLTRCMPAWADILEGDFAAAVAPYRQMFEMDPSNPMASMRIALSDLRLDHLTVLYPGDQRYSLERRVTVVPLAEVARMPEVITPSQRRRRA